MLEDKDHQKNKVHDNDKIMDEAKKRLTRAIDATASMREAALEDVRFRAGDQWPEMVRKKRESEGRPCLTFNHLETYIDQVIAAQRQNRPAIKVRPVAASAGMIKSNRVRNIAGDRDYDLAQIYEGLIRNIEYNSSAEHAYDTAADHAVGHGFGYIRVSTRYASDDSFDQDIEIKRIPNAFSVYLDPDHKEADGRDAQFAFITEWIEKSEFERRYKQIIPSSFEIGGESSGSHWYEGDRIRIAEYFRRAPVKRTLAMLSDGTVIDLGNDQSDVNAARKALKDEGRRIVRERVVNSHKVEWLLLSGAGVLEGPKTWPGKFIPVVPVYGKELNVDGKTTYRGVIRHAKDAQRNYNYWQSTATELVALSPKTPFIGGEKAFDGYEDIWKTANVENHAYLPVNEETKLPPQRQPGPEMPAGVLERIQAARQDEMQTIGIFQASLGEQGNETTGRAILARQRKGDLASFVFSDNLARAVEQVGRILIDLIPRVYDAERVIRLRNDDDSEDYIRINFKAGNKLYHDLAAAKYDVVVKVGPSYSTQRMEAVEAMIQMTQVNPALWNVIGDLIVLNMDWPLADDMAKRLKKLVPTEILSDMNAPVGQANMQAVETNAMMQAEMTLKKTQFEAAMATAEAEKAKAAAAIMAIQNGVRKAEQ